MKKRPNTSFWRALALRFLAASLLPLLLIALLSTFYLFRANVEQTTQHNQQLAKTLRSELNNFLQDRHADSSTISEIS